MYSADLDLTTKAHLQERQHPELGFLTDDSATQHSRLSYRMHRALNWLGRHLPHAHIQHRAAGH